MKIGFVGLGIMGKAMALNLVKAGLPVEVWNRTEEKTLPLRQAGANVAASLGDLARTNDVLITMVKDTSDVEEVVFGEQGLARGLGVGKIFIDMSTISPEATEGFAAKLEEIGCHMLDAPVSGGDIGAQHGTLTIMVGGEESTFSNCLPVFRALGKKIVMCGGHGDGQRMKMINQILCGLHAVALSEAFVLADSIGLDLKLVHEVVSSGAAGSWALDNYGPRVLNNDLGPGFKLGMQQKDLRIAHDTAQRLGGIFQGTAVAYELFTAAKEQGFGDLGSHGLIKLYREKVKAEQP